MNHRPTMRTCQKATYEAPRREVWTISGTILANDSMAHCLLQTWGGGGKTGEEGGGEVPFSRSEQCFRKRDAKSCKLSEGHAVFWCSGYTPYHVFCSWSKRASVRHLFFREISASRNKNFTDKFWDAAAQLCKGSAHIEEEENE